MSNTKTVKINVYAVGGDWFAARWIDGEYDGSDELDTAEGASVDEAKTLAQLEGRRIAREWGTPHEVVITCEPSHH